LERDSVGTGSDAEAFHATIHNDRGSVWQHWRQHFAEPYASVPGLEPLSIVYSRPENHYSASDRNTVVGEGIPAPQISGSVGTDRRRQSPCMKGKPRLTIQGVSRAVGLRKSSIADVRVAHGEGRIFINDQV